MRAFVYETHEKYSILRQAKYRLKECWTLVLLWFLPWHTENYQPVILHNSLAKPWHFKLTQNFVESKTGRDSIGGRRASIVSVLDAGIFIRFLSACIAIPIMLLPNSVLMAISRVIMSYRLNKYTPPIIILFCDAHLSGFILVLALKSLDCATATLQHGLYRRDDKGSTMAFKNFVADRILLWDCITAKEFSACGYAGRSEVVGQYKVKSQDQRFTMKQDLVFFCPPYDERLLEYFLVLAKRLGQKFDVLMSVHPLLRHRVHLKVQSIVGVKQLPSVSICGDSGVIIDCLAMGVPVISVGERSLCACHLEPNMLPALSVNDFNRLRKCAADNLMDDSKRFGVR